MTATVAGWRSTGNGQRAHALVNQWFPNLRRRRPDLETVRDPTSDEFRPPPAPAPQWAAAWGQELHAYTATLKCSDVSLQRNVTCSEQGTAKETYQQQK